jgi:aerobic-type carbon monoxide dehydrogenase small subunit (CoxS/CutS family)
MLIHFLLNGRPTDVDVPADMTLLTLLRDQLDMVGTKCGCEIGECGACSVILDGAVVNACLVLAPQVTAHSVVTIEGIRGADGGPNDLQEAFIEAGAVQCGFCTPGMIVAATALLQKHNHPTREQTIEGLSGNLCRCTGYQQIVDAVALVASRRAGEEVARG